jgi:hypothetical protein
VRYRPNVHTLLGLGRWISIEGEVHGRPIRLRVESRVRDTMLGNLALGPWLRDSIERWRLGQPLETEHASVSPVPEQGETETAPE